VCTKKVYARLCPSWVCRSFYARFTVEYFK
jgi:hypothetical protein